MQLQPSASTSLCVDLVSNVNSAIAKQQNWKPSHICRVPRGDLPKVVLCPGICCSKRLEDCAQGALRSLHMSTYGSPSGGGGDFVYYQGCTLHSSMSSTAWILLGMGLMILLGVQLYSPARLRTKPCDSWQGKPPEHPDAIKILAEAPLESRYSKNSYLRNVP